MRPVETGAKKKRRRRDLRNAMLLTIGTAGIIAVAAIAPNMFQLLGKSGLLARLKNQSKGVLTRLKIKGHIEFIERDGKNYARLTERGEAVLVLEREKMALIQTRKKKWDRRYRLVIFDIPERRRRVRDSLRISMSEVGFLRVQNSAWVYPYDCEEFIALLKADLHLGKDVLYAVVENIENDVQIRKHFNLPFD